MYRKETFKIYSKRLEVWANQNRKMTFSIMMGILIGSFALVRYQVYQKEQSDSVQPLELMGNVKRATSHNITTQFGDLMEYFGDLEDLKSLSGKQELTREDSVKLESIKKKLINQYHEEN